MDCLRTLFFILFIICPFLKTSGQVKSDKSSIAKANPAETPAILKIRQTYNQINTLTLKKEKFNYEAEACVEDGVVTYYMDKKEILKITESGSIGDGSWKSEYYYRGGKVIFYYDVMIGGPAIGKVTKTERRVYIENDQAIRTQENKKIIKADARSTEIIQTAYKLLKAYQTKDFASALCNP